MAECQLPSIKQLRQLLVCDPERGRLYWREREGVSRAVSAFNKRFAGKEALIGKSVDGYKRGKVLGVPVRAHRVIWAMFHGDWPLHQIDHINGIRSDNRISNLRAVTNAENMKNQFRSPRNTSGATGVYWSLKPAMWRSTIKCNGKRISLGYFKDFEAAVAARKRAEQELGFSQRHGAAMQPGPVPTF